MTLNLEEYPVRDFGDLSRAEGVVSDWQIKGSQA
jgi:hypothetical protein